jgi:hypothetical protein
LKDYELLNYFLPVHCGSPDMANKNLDIFHYNSIKNIPFLNKLNNYSLFLALAQFCEQMQKDKIINKEFNNNNEEINKNFNSYLAGLFEGDGHI